MQGVGIYVCDMDMVWMQVLARIALVREGSPEAIETAPSPRVTR